MENMRPFESSIFELGQFQKFRHFEGSKLLSQETPRSATKMALPFATFKKRAIADLKKVDIIEQESDIQSVHELNVPRSYPILTTDYREKLAGLNRQIKKYPNIVTTGRQARFSYNNTDIIIKETLNSKVSL